MEEEVEGTKRNRKRRRRKGQRGEGGLTKDST